MRNSDIALHDVVEGTFLFLGYDPLLADPLAAYLFCEPERVLAVTRGAVDEADLLRADAMVVRAKGWAGHAERSVALEMTSRDGGRVIVLYPDDRHIVAGVNLPGEDPSAI